MHEHHTGQETEPGRRPSADAGRVADVSVSPARSRRRWIMGGVVAVVLVVAIIVGGGYGWPGWWRDTSACTLLSTRDVSTALALPPEMTARDPGPRYDTVTGVPVTLCLFAGGDGVVVADLETGEFPAQRVISDPNGGHSVGCPDADAGPAGQLACNAAMTADGIEPASVAGADAAVWAADLGGKPSLALLAVRVVGGNLDLVIAAADQRVHPTRAALEQLVHTALANQ